MGLKILYVRLLKQKIFLIYYLLYSLNIIKISKFNNINYIFEPSLVYNIKIMGKGSNQDWGKIFN